MTPHRPLASLPSDGLGVPHGQHICLLYGNEDEQLHTTTAFLSAALAQENKLLYVTDTKPVEDVRRWFAGKLGIQPSDAAWEVKTTAEAYLPNGRFEPEAMCADLEEFSRRACAAGFKGCRCTGEMGWAARKPPGAERLIEYEEMLNGLIERLPFSGICQYDVRLFDGPTILAVIEVHPFLLVRGQILRNPNHVRKSVAA